MQRKTGLSYRPRYSHKSPSISGGASLSGMGIGEVCANIDRWREGLRERIERAMERIATLLVEHARSQHSWNDRTGETDRSTIATVTELSAECVRVTLRVGTPYAPFLELAREGKWAWLWPTMIACEGEIHNVLEDLQSLCNTPPRQ